MKSIFLIRYRMSGGHVSMVPVYAANIAEAMYRFGRRMGDMGCERGTYTVIERRQIIGPDLDDELHADFLSLLTCEELADYHADRSARRTNYKKEYAQ